MRKMIIFGATSAMASHAARNFAVEGTQFALVARNGEHLEEVAADLQARGGEVVFKKSCDLAEIENHAALLSELHEAIPDFDTVLIAYGTLGEQSLAANDFNEARSLLEVNFLSVVSLLTPLAMHFEKKHSGTLAVIGSVAGDRGRQSNYIYGTAKGALGIFLQGLRNRLHASGVSVVTIKPGFVDTPMTASFKKGLLWADAESAGRGIYKAIVKGRSVAYVPFFWWAIMLIIRLIPEPIFKRMKL